MSSTGANRESEGGTMKKVIDNPATEPQSHTYAEDQSRSNTGQQGGKCSSGISDHKPVESYIKIIFTICYSRKNVA
ncbi:unnamed protein product [Rotaria sp. Silwood1]|nr:unnamed protein product [Rotaria sp. Silwood1]CAF1299545.1 unnamed protein product [Rotaria sp. Silwood1]CAF3468025.1 unnamed protein product [Rotaria sp. Silwood1]CAF3508308.1 unnamed protein product [Rotaria sp. Silwood1]CAF3513906.1 unnamed protein product [Rotaria sp. Silwood1]